MMLSPVIETERLILRRNENNKASSKVLIKAGVIKDGYIANRRINLDGTYSGVEYYSKKK